MKRKCENQMEFNFEKEIIPESSSENKKAVLENKITENKKAVLENKITENKSSVLPKFGFITDTHYDFKYNSRKDDTLKSLMDKTRQCYQWFEDNGCEFVIHGGDMFDRHRIYNFDMIYSVWETICKSKMKTYFIMGQHDLQGYNPDTLKNSNLGFISSISNGRLVLIKDEEYISGYCFAASHVNIDPVERIKSIGKHDVPVVCVCHALLTEKREAFGTISIKHFKNPNVSLILSGDLHEGVPFQKCNGIQFYNPGSLSRDARTERLPKAGILQWNGNEFTLDEFYPDCLPAKDIFFYDEKDDITSEIIKEENEIKDNEKNFIEAFREFHSEAKDAYELLAKIGEKNGISKEVLELIKTYKDRMTH